MNIHRWFLAAAILAVGACADSTPAPAGPDFDAAVAAQNGKTLPDGVVYNEYNRNYYAAVPAAGISWYDAAEAAAGMSIGRCESHLAAVTSQRENDWLVATFPEVATEGYWLGGLQEAGAVEPGGGWGWVTGENWLYTNWNYNPPFTIEPNDLNGEEALQFAPVAYFGGDGSWNDLNGSTPGVVGGYVVEFDCPVKVTGGGQVLRDLGGDVIQTRVYGFNAQRNPDTSVKGEAQGRISPLGDVNVAFHSDVTCTSVWGNEAWLGTVVTQSNDPAVPVGRTYLWRMVDHGQGSAADADGLTLYFYFPDDSPIDQNCALQPTGSGYDLFFELERGNLVIH